MEVWEILKDLASDSEGIRRLHLKRTGGSALVVVSVSWLVCLSLLSVLLLLLLLHPLSFLTPTTYTRARERKERESGGLTVSFHCSFSFLVNQMVGENDTAVSLIQPCCYIF